METFDVVVIGSGISGISACYHLKKNSPKSTFICLERRSSFGGTWNLFQYPGIRSDSDMFTFGYSFRPWPSSKTIAPASDILEYLRDTIDHVKLHKHIRYNHHVLKAEWSSQSALWSIECENGAKFLSKFLFACTGYYNYDHGYEPTFKGSERFVGAGNKIVHPQKWTDDVEYANKQVVIIGSGATAVTLVPSLAEKAQHVIMLQRSPTYIMAMPNGDPFAKSLTSWGIPDSVVHPLVRWKKVFQSLYFTRMLNSKTPEENKKMFIGFMRSFTKNVPSLADDKDFAKHFTPPYNPWEQRMCLAPDGDFYKALRKGKASIVTDTIETFDEKGILLSSGKHIDADLIVTATGLQLQENYPMATMHVFVDGTEYIAAEHFVYKGCMLNDVPNFAFVSGYFNASWTLKADIVCSFVSRVINHLHQTNTYCVPHPDGDLEPYTILTDNSPGYVKRTSHLQPKYTENGPWSRLTSYIPDRLQLEWYSIKEKSLQFKRRPNYMHGTRSFL